VVLQIRGWVGLTTHLTIVLLRNVIKSLGLGRNLALNGLSLGKHVLRKILCPKGDEVTGGWKKLHNEGLVFFAKNN
jgi:hypothetical protein